MRELCVGVVGAGQMGTFHASTLSRAVSGARLAAVITRKVSGAADLLGEHPEACWYRSVDDAINAGAIDALIVATPAGARWDVLAPALRAGLPVLCEKPLAADIGTAQRLIEAEQHLDRPRVQVGFMRRFDPEHIELRDIVESGTLGALLLLRASHRNPAPPAGFTQEMIISDAVVHELDSAPWLAGSSLTSIEVRYPRPNSGSPEPLAEPILVFATLDNGVVLDLEMNVTAGFGYQVTTEAVFERGVVRIGETDSARVWANGHLGLREHASYATRFDAAFTAQLQRWVDAITRGDYVAGPNAWDGLAAAIATQAGITALSGGVQDVNIPDRPLFYS